MFAVTSLSKNQIVKESRHIFCVYQLTVDGIKNCCMCLSNGAGGGIRTPEPYGPAYKAGAFDHSATPAKWDLRENQEHTISNMLYRLQRRENQKSIKFSKIN